MPSGKLCKSCVNDISDLSENLFSNNSDVIPTWFKQIGNYSLLPPPINCDVKFNLYNKNLKRVKSIHPFNYNTKITISTKNLLPKVKNRWVFYWASKNRDYFDTKYPNSIEAYGKFNNCGLAKINNKHEITFLFKNPVPYQVDGIAYPPHLHFVELQKNKLWSTRCHTYLITPNICLHTFTTLLTKDKYIILNAMPSKTDCRIIPNTHRLPFTTCIGKINSIIKTFVSKEMMEYFALLRNVPIIVYGDNKKSSCTIKLIDKLRELSYINIISFEGGLDEYYGSFN